MLPYSWHLQLLAGGHQRTRNEFLHTWCLPIHLSVGLLGAF
jgi:hypothetical protein